MSMAYQPQLTAQHFFICSEWQEIKYNGCYVMKDCSTNELYNGDDLMTIRRKCVLLIVSSPISQSLAIFYKMLHLLCKLVTVDAFSSNAQANLNFIQKCNLFLINILHFLVMPLVIVMLDLALLYGIFFPLDGRKLYNSLFLFFYEDTITRELSYPTAFLAPCFKPFKKLEDQEEQITPPIIQGVIAGT
jgi:hypothetical protein